MVLIGAGRPVLLVPRGVASVAARRVVVAWKDTRESRRALADALPFLTRAEEVLVLEICEQGEAGRAAAEFRVGDVAAHLALHGVKAVAQVRPLQDRAVADELVRAAGQQGADLIVAGGYAHARLWELAWGGVTRALIRRSPICCVLSH